ncbi:MAG TPA: aldose 1-epimerase family protein [Glaciihabitans sp.]|jgi:aldose 1-epimerase|nr:aldose 1-epimerase family protein [Glaciihabitans sp.]
MRAPTGEQFVLTRSTPNGPAEAIITQVAASLRTLTIGGVDLTQPYPEHTTPPFCCGVVLVPWPNRIKDGVWTLDGAEQQLGLSEPDRHNAIHGLLMHTAYRLVERTEDSVTLAASVFPERGYPFALETTVTYELVDDGLRVTHGIRNESDVAAPTAIGAHPFLQIGDVPTADLTLTVHAATRFPVDERLNVSAEVPVEGRYDLREGQKVGGLSLDDAFGELTPVDRVTASLTAPDGRSVSLWQDENFPYVQVFTTSKFPAGDGVTLTNAIEPDTTPDELRTLAIAIEPMTAPADAFNSGQSLTWVQPGETFTATWGIAYRA